jgi:hypothetical protein
MENNGPVDLKRYERDRIELFLCCKQLKNMDILSLTDVQIRVYLAQGEKWNFIGQTEVIDDNLNPEFAKTIQVDYHFEVKQRLRFEVGDIDKPNKFNFIGEVFATLGELIGAKNQTVILPIQYKNEIRGKLVVRSEPVRYSNDQVKMQIRHKGLKHVESWLCGVFGKNKPFLCFYRKREDGSWVKTHQTEFLPEPYRVFAEFVMPVQALCNADYYRPIKVIAFTKGSGYREYPIGECEFSLNQIVAQPEKTLQLHNSSKTINRQAGTLTFEKFEIVQKSTFLDYIKQGMQMNVIVAIDFTSSNGIPTELTSLHAMRFDGSPNEYQQAIKQVCDVLLDYDTDKQVPVYGFGAEPRFKNMYSPMVSHCFPCNGDVNNHYVKEMDGILSAYGNALKQCKFDGPTLFTPIFQQAMTIAMVNKQSQSPEYTILLVITDGIIDDMEPTINCLIQSARLPLSIIIVGVGNADFTNMKILDGDNGLENADGVKAERDLVQFVPFREFKENPSLLAAEVLQEIPDQVVEYMTLCNIKPEFFRGGQVGQEGRAKDMRNKYAQDLHSRSTLESEGLHTDHIQDMGFMDDASSQVKVHYPNL